MAFFTKIGTMALFLCWIEVNTSQYKPVVNKRELVLLVTQATWNDARDYCQSVINGTLMAERSPPFAAMLNRYSENEWQNVWNGDKLWLGLFIEDINIPVFSWVKSCKYVHEDEYHAFGTMYPRAADLPSGKLCGYRDFQRDSWNFEKCAIKLSAVCAKKKGPCTYEKDTKQNVCLKGIRGSDITNVASQGDCEDLCSNSTVTNEGECWAVTYIPHSNMCAPSFSTDPYNFDPTTSLNYENPCTNPIVTTISNETSVVSWKRCFDDPVYDERHIPNLHSIALEPLHNCSATEAQETTTEQPSTTTAQPLLPTAQPIPTTAQPSSTTAQPSTTTEQPIPTTEQPIPTTEQPIPTTEQPSSTTAQPIPTTEQPIPTTEQPIPISEQPIPTTEQPIPTTEHQIPTTEHPIPTTEHPILTTEQPIPTTEQPSSTNAQPIPTTEQPIPTTEQPIPTTAQPSTTIVQEYFYPSTRLKRRLILLAKYATFNDAASYCRSELNGSLITHDNRGIGVMIYNYQNNEWLEWKDELFWVGIFVSDLEVPSFTYQSNCTVINVEAFHRFKPSKPTSTSLDPSHLCVMGDVEGRGWYFEECDSPLSAICEQIVGPCTFERDGSDSSCTTGANSIPPITVENLAECEKYCFLIEPEVWGEGECWAVTYLPETGHCIPGVDRDPLKFDKGRQQYQNPCQHSNVTGLSNGTSFVSWRRCFEDPEYVTSDIPDTSIQNEEPTIWCDSATSTVPSPESTLIPTTGEPPITSMSVDPITVEPTPMTSKGPDDPTCECTCSLDVNITVEEKTLALKEKLTLNKKDTSAHTRARTSAPDDRPSARGVGMALGVGMLVGVIGVISLGDIISVTNFLYSHLTK